MQQRIANRIMEKIEASEGLNKDDHGVVMLKSFLDKPGFYDQVAPRLTNLKNVKMSEGKEDEANFLDELLKSRGESKPSRNQLLNSLNHAIRSGKVIQAAMLLENPAVRELINDKDNEGKLPLHHAMEAGNVELVKLLLRAGAAVFTQGDGISCPYVRLWYLERGKNEEIRDIITSHARKEFEKAKSTGDKLIKLDIIFGCGIPEESLEKANEVLKSVFPARIQDSQNASTVPWFNQLDVEGKLPLHHAMEYGCVTIVNFLLAKGASVFLPGDGGLNCPFLCTYVPSYKDMQQSLISQAKAEFINSKSVQEKLDKLEILAKHEEITGKDLLEKLSTIDPAGHEEQFQKLEALAYAKIQQAIDRKSAQILFRWEADPNLRLQLNDPVERMKIVEELVVEDVPEVVLQVADKLEDPKLFEEYVLSYNQQNSFGPADSLISDILNPSSLPRFQRLVERGYPITANTIAQAFYSCNYSAIEFVLKNTKDEVLLNNAEALLKLVKDLEEPRIAQMLIQRFPQIFSQVNIFELLSQAIPLGHSFFVEWALANGVKLTDEQLRKLVSSAELTFNLHFIKMLHTIISQRTASPSEYLKILGLEFLTPSEVTDFIATCAIVSPIEDIYELARHYPKMMARCLPEVLGLAALAVRFPNLESYWELNDSCKSIGEYLKNSLAYAKENLKFVRDESPKFSNSTRDEFLNAVIANRFQRRPNLDLAYERKQIDHPTSSFTRLQAFRGRQISTFNRATNRYWWSKRHFAGLVFNQGMPPKKVLNSYNSVNISEPVNINYCYSAKDASGQSKRHILTTFSNLDVWIHTEPGVIKALQPHLEELEREILDFPLNSTNRKEFMAKVATGYWLIATLCETHRGTPHNAMIWLNKVYYHHGLPPPIPKQEHFFLDNTMLMLPLEKVIADWETYFEPTIDQAMVEVPNRREILASMLQQNGLLLSCCSDEVRNDPELAAIAVQQNPEASKYVPSTKKVAL